MELAALLCEADMATIARLKKGNAYYYATVIIFPADLEEYLKNLAHPPGRGTIIGRTLLEGKVVHLYDVLADPNTRREHSTPRKELVIARGSVCPCRVREYLSVSSTCCAGRCGHLPTSRSNCSRPSPIRRSIAIENVRLFDEVQARTRALTESLQQQTATADVLKVISRSTFDLQTVLNTLMESATRLCNADQGTITRKIGEAFFRSAAYGYSAEYTDYMRETPVEMDRGSVAGRALVDGQIVHIADIKADFEYTFSPGLHLGDFRTAIGVPMLREGVAIGVLALTRKEILPFTDKQIEMATTFADQAAIAIENARLLNELRDSLDQQTATSQVLGVISSSPTDIQPVFDTIAKNAVNLCGATYCIAYNFDGEMIRMLAYHNLDKAALDALNQIWPMRPKQQVSCRTNYSRA